MVVLEFVPAGKTDLVLTVDLIDAGSVRGLKENVEVPVEYEARWLARFLEPAAYDGADRGTAAGLAQESPREIRDGEVAWARSVQANRAASLLACAKGISQPGCWDICPKIGITGH